MALLICDVLIQVCCALILYIPLGIHLLYNGLLAVAQGWLWLVGAIFQLLLSAVVFTFETVLPHIFTEALPFVLTKCYSVAGDTFALILKLLLSTLSTISTAAVWLFYILESVALLIYDILIQVCCALILYIPLGIHLLYNGLLAVAQGSLWLVGAILHHMQQWAIISSSLHFRAFSTICFHVLPAWVNKTIVHEVTYVATIAVLQLWIASRMRHRPWLISLISFCSLSCFLDEAPSSHCILLLCSPICTLTFLRYFAHDLHAARAQPSIQDKDPSEFDMESDKYIEVLKSLNPELNLNRNERLSPAVEKRARNNLDDVCVLCLENFESTFGYSERDLSGSRKGLDNHIVALVPCGHIFHFGCYIKWLKNCPFCSQPVQNLQRLVENCARTSDRRGQEVGPGLRNRWRPN